MSEEQTEPDTEPPGDAVVRVNWGLLGEWWCADINTTEEEILAAIQQRFSLDIGQELIRDRLYGGFKCTFSNRRHIHFSTGQYTYLGTNRPLDPADRLEKWKELLDSSIEHLEDGGFIGGPWFCKDAPV